MSEWISPNLIYNRKKKLEIILTQLGLKYLKIFYYFLLFFNIKGLKFILFNLKKLLIKTNIYDILFDDNFFFCFIKIKIPFKKKNYFVKLKYHINK